MDCIRYVYKNLDCCQTLVIDTADAAEVLCKRKVCAENKWDGIEVPGYGKGYVFLAEQFGKMLDALSDLKDKGINIVVVGHSYLRKFEQPDEFGAYDRYELKLEKKTAPLLKEWADMMLFLNYKTVVVQDSNKKFKAQGGKRVMYTTHHPAWDAKNRFGLPEEMEVSFDGLEGIIMSKGAAKEPVEITNDPIFDDPDFEEVKEPDPDPEPEGDGIPPELKQLMDEKDVTEEMIVQAVAARGFFPEVNPETGEMMRIQDYPSDWVDRMLIGKWNGFYNKFIKGEK